MSRVTTQEIMNKLEEIESLIRLDKFITLGYFFISTGVAVVSIGYFIKNNVMLVFGILLCFSGIQSFFIHYILNTSKKITKRRFWRK